MQQTTNYNLKKPGMTDTVADSIPAYADNLDDIDTLIKGLDDGKVDKISGKGLSTNDYTTDEKNKLAGIDADAIDGKLEEIEDWEAAHLQASNPHSITPALIGAETPTGAQQKANQAETNAKSYADGVLESANSHTDQVASDLSQKVDETKIKVLDVEQDVSNITKALTNLNPNHEAKQSVSGYGILSLPKNAANSPVSVTVKGRTWNNRAGAGDTSPQTIENLDSTKTYLLINSLGKNVTVDTVDIATPVKLTGATSYEFEWTEGKIALYELSATEAALTEAELGARYHYVDSTKSTLSGKVQIKDAEENITGEAYYDGILKSVGTANDEVRVSEGKLIKRVRDEYVLQESDFGTMQPLTNVAIITVPFNALPNPPASGIITAERNKMFLIYGKTSVAIDIDNVDNIGKFYINPSNIAFICPRDMTVPQAKQQLAGLTLIYQLAEPIITKIPAQLLTAGANHTVYWLHEIADAGIYDGGISILNQELPIKSLKRIANIDFMTGAETELNVATAVIAGDKKSFTHPDLTNDDIVFFEYEYPSELTTVPELEVGYLDSRYVVEDTENGKLYSWKIVSTNGVGSLVLTEVV